MQIITYVNMSSFPTLNTLTAFNESLLVPLCPHNIQIRITVAKTLGWLGHIVDIPHILATGTQIKWSKHLAVIFSVSVYVEYLRYV